MFPRKSSLATIDYPIHNLVIPPGPPITRRFSAAPFSLTRVPTTDTKYSTLGTSNHSKILSSQEPHHMKLEDTRYERAFFVRMGQRLSAFLPKGAPGEHQGSPVLRIKMNKEVHVATEEATRGVGIGSNGNEGPLLDRLPYLWKSPSEERIHGSYIRDSGVSLRPATAPGGSVERRSQGKPAPLYLVDSTYRVTTRIEQSYPSCSEQFLFQSPPPTQSYSAASEAPMSPRRSNADSSHEDTSNKQTGIVCATNKTSIPIPPPVPPRSPKRTQHMPHYKASASSKTVSTVTSPIRDAQMRSLGTTWKSLFGRRARKEKKSYNKNEAVLVVRKASSKRKKGKAAHSPYQPYSARAVAPSPVHNPEDSRRESPVLSRSFSFKISRTPSRKRKSGLPSFLPIDSSDSLT